MPSETYGWVGLGRMGEPMARRVAALGAPLHVWNRTGSRAVEFARGAGGVAHAAATPREAAEQSTILFVMLSTPEATAERAAGDDGFLAGLKRGALVVVMGVGSSRVDLQACKLEYSIVSPK